MSPEEALQHEWLHTSVTSTISSSSSSSSQVGTCERRAGVVNGSGPAGNPRRQGPITQDSTEEDNYSLYKVYKGKRHRDTGVVVSEVGAKQDATTGNTNTTTSNTGVNGNPEGTSTENSLDDSGTFLPPIL